MGGPCISCAGSKPLSKHSTLTVKVRLSRLALTSSHLSVGFVTLYRRAVTPAHLVDQIGHVLRVRVLQELELLADEMDRNSHHHWHDGIKPSAPTTILRRLTREEFQSVRETGVVSYPNALAVLVAPQ